jgi:hypothetical protein
MEVHEQAKGSLVDRGHNAGAQEKDLPVQANLKSLSFILTLVALAPTVFCVALDNVMIVTAIPRITDDYRAVKDIGWYGSAYLLLPARFSFFQGSSTPDTQQSGLSSELWPYSRLARSYLL